MKISRFTIYKFKLELNRAIRIGGQHLNFRRGYLIKLEDHAGKFGFGEAMPLPGLHRESYEDCFEQLLEACKNLLHKVLPQNPFEITEKILLSEESAGLFPSVRFALDTALFNLCEWCGFLETDLPDGLPQLSIAVNGLLSGSVDEIVHSAQALVNKGYTNLKIKVGRTDIKEESGLVNKLVDNLPHTITFRLDANRSWSFEEALRFARAIPCDRIEYIEEPLKDFRLLPEFFMETQLPYALDESIPQVEQSIPEFSEGLVAFVLKPNVLGGFKSTKLYTDLCRQNKIKAVLSDTFNSGISVASIALFHAHFIRQEIPIGLDTYRYLKNDVLSKCFVIENGRLDVSGVLESIKSVNLSRLDEVYEG